MKITIVFAARSNLDSGLYKLLKIIQNVYSELEVEIIIINLLISRIPYYDGETDETVKEMNNLIKNTQGVIFVYSSVVNSPAAILQTFFEHFTIESNSRLLQDKNCMIITSSKDGSARKGAERVGEIIARLGGYESSRICVSDTDIGLLENDAEMKNVFEKQLEDFYRYIRQGRKFFVYSESSFKDAKESGVNKKERKPKQVKAVGDDENLLELLNKSPLFGQPPDTKKKPPELLSGLDDAPPSKVAGYSKNQRIKDVYKKNDISKMNTEQKKDISEISQLLVNKFSTSGNGDNLVLKGKQKIEADFSDKSPRSKTVKQMLQSLPYRIKKKAAENLDVTFQFQVTGAESFESVLTIRDSECYFSEGTAESPDIVIMTEDKMMSDVLNGKYTTQKAFMVGHIKVRGNFVLLSKFDQLFAE